MRSADFFWACACIAFGEFVVLGMLMPAVLAVLQGVRP